jgi:RNA polymerase sigma-70 factor, ECF subfamily
VPDSFHDQFVAVFDAQFNRIYRYLDRLSGDAELAGDLAQETFVKLYQRGTLPETPSAWLITVAMNLFRNARSTTSRRRHLLTVARGERVHSDWSQSPDAAASAADNHERVRLAIDRLPERERRLLLLHAEGFSYRDIALALELNEASVGTLLARARKAFRSVYEDAFDAP